MYALQEIAYTLLVTSWFMTFAVFAAWIVHNF
jgi:hypothetical protein